MAITTLNQALAGMQPPQPLLKLGSAASTLGLHRTWTPWYSSGIPGGSTATTVGVDGEVVTPALGASVGGRIPRSNPGGGLEARLARLILNCNLAGTFWLVDRLWHNSGLSVTSTAAQSLSGVTIPARDRNGAALGDGVFCAVEWSTDGGSGTPTITISGVDQTGASVATVGTVAVNNPKAGTMETISNIGESNGLRSITSYQASATRTTGTFHLVLFRPIAILEVNGLNTAGSLDLISGGAAKIPNDAVLQLIWWPISTAIPYITGQYIETWG